MAAAVRVPSVPSRIKGLRTEGVPLYCGRKISADRQDRRFREGNPGEDGHTCGSRCTLEQLATARVPHLDWLALPDHCFTAAETAKRTQKQVCPHAPRSGAKCCGRNACAEVRGVLSCTLLWPERSARGRPKLRKFEARALVQLLVAWEQSSVDAIAFSASLTGENLPAAGRPTSKKSAI